MSLWVTVTYKLFNWLLTSLAGLEAPPTHRRRGLDPQCMYMCVYMCIDTYINIYTYMLNSTVTLSSHIDSSNYEDI